MEMKPSKTISKMVFYSDFGYLEVKKEDYENENHLIKFEKQTLKLFGNISKKSLRDYIYVNVKTFYGKRLTYLIRVNIADYLSDLSAKIVICEDTTLNPYDKRWNYRNQYRLISTSKDKVRELNPSKTFYEEDVRENQTLVILPQKKILFSEVQIGPNIYLENNCTVAYKLGSDDHQIVIADQGFKSGRHYFEFIFETEPAEKSIVVGVCLTRNDYYINLSDPRGFWGFIPSDSKKIGYNEKGVIDKSEYGAICKIGDTVGILMEFNVKGLDLTFFVNKVNLGCAFKNLSLQTYYPCAILGFDSSRVHLLNQVEFPE